MQLNCVKMLYRSAISETKSTCLQSVRLYQLYYFLPAYMNQIYGSLIPAWCSTCFFSMSVSAELKQSQLSYSLSLWLFIKAAVLKVGKSHGLLEGGHGFRRPLLLVGGMNHPLILKRLPLSKYAPGKNQEESFSVEATDCWGSAHGSSCRVCRQDHKTWKVAGRSQVPESEVLQKWGNRWGMVFWLDKVIGKMLLWYVLCVLLNNGFSNYAGELPHWGGKYRSWHGDGSYSQWQALEVLLLHHLFRPLKA